MNVINITGLELGVVKLQLGWKMPFVYESQGLDLYSVGNIETIKAVKQAGNVLWM